MVFQTGAVKIGLLSENIYDGRPQSVKVATLQRHAREFLVGMVEKPRMHDCRRHQHLLARAGNDLTANPQRIG